MKTPILSLLLVLFILTGTVKAQDAVSFYEKGYQLKFISNDPKFDQELKKRMIRAYFDVYPKLAVAYNPKTIKQVTFVIDTAYKGVAATSNGIVTYSAKYMAEHPGDIDVVTHEVMHIVQNYGDSVGPWWLTEGIADFARYKFGIDNGAANWSLPAYKSTQKYDNGYRVTARFLAWVEKSKPGVIKQFDAQLRDHTYTADSWQKLTGSTLDNLWAKYIQNPEI